MGGYAGAQDVVRREAGIEASGAELLGRWESLVGECEDGYAWDISELRNELGARDQLERILQAETLQAWPEHDELRNAVHAIDRRYRGLLLPGAEFAGEARWWRRGVLRFSGAPYAEYCKKAHGFDVRRVP